MVSPSSILLRSTISKTIIRSLQTATTSASSTPGIDSSLFSPNTSYLAPTHLDDSPSPATLQRLAKYSSVSLATYSRPPFILTHGKKCSIWDADGREYLDFSGGIAVNALGHSDEGVQKVLSEQSGKLVHNSNLWHNEWAGELALLLVEKTKELGGLGYAPTTASPAPSEGRAESTPSHSSGLKVFFSNSGTEANEGALKFARKWGKLSSPSTFPSTLQKACGCTTCTCKSELVSFKDGFHGRSMGALSATWQEKYQAPFAPLVPGFRMGVLNDIEGLKETITERTCGVIVEPIQGEGGILEASVEFLAAVRARCDEVGALLIFDEIQCGLGRTGTFWAHSHLPIEAHPDIVTMAKPLANGIPIGAILMKDKVADIIKIGDHGTTFGGGPLQTAVAHHVLQRITAPSFLPNVLSLSTFLQTRLRALPSLFPTLLSGSPRGRGLILGLPFQNDDYVNRIVKMARERGLLLLSCGKSTIRFVPSLVVTEEEVGRCCDVLESCLVVLQKEVEQSQV